MGTCEDIPTGNSCFLQLLQLEIGSNLVILHMLLQKIFT